MQLPVFSFFNIFFRKVAHVLAACKGCVYVLVCDCFIAL